MIMVQLIKKGGFREKAARQSKYKDSVNHQADIPQNSAYQDREQTQSKDQPNKPSEPPKSS
jgi:hypothetical protein